MNIVHFSKSNVLFFLLFMLCNPAFAEKTETIKQDTKQAIQQNSLSPIETDTKTLNGGKTTKKDSFDYTHTFYREKPVLDSTGKSEIKREYVTQTLPGEQLLAVATYTYKKNTPTKQIVFTLPIPQEATYVEGSASHQECVWFSIDGGKNWSQYQDLRITEVNGKQRGVTGNDITHLQWRMTNNFKKGDSGDLEYKVIIR